MMMAPKSKYIKVYARVKKERDVHVDKNFKITESKNGHYKDLAFLKLIGNSEENCAPKIFRFNDIFQEHNQEDVFNVTAKPVVESVLLGFNGTIFAYGQTNSGKTYSMTGSAKKFHKRGIIPRSLQYIFSEIEKIEDKPTLYISYIEIYNEICYDLLSPRDTRIARSLEELPRVIVQETKKGEPQLKNVSVIPITTEEDALRLLFLGETNRAIAETPSNEYSTRSHCIFTIYINSKFQNNHRIVYSKLNLVDLAGSERVYKSNISGNILHEAKYINLSLHFLQQVIMALSEAKRTHIPYRNSLMTFILKDSLGGNCLTVMLATLSLNWKNWQESISTCKFAQRVSIIKLDPVVNEILDPHKEISLLRNEVSELRKLLTENRFQQINNNKPLTTQQKLMLDEKMLQYIKTDHNENKILSSTMKCEEYQYCLSVLKHKILNLEAAAQEKVEMVQNVDIINRDKIIIPNNATEEVEDIEKLLSKNYERAKYLASKIEQCQINIINIRKKIELASNLDQEQKLNFCKELGKEQKIYRSSLVELKEVKNETLQLEAGLINAKRILKSASNVKANEDYFISSNSSYCIEETEMENAVINVKFLSPTSPINVIAEETIKAPNCPVSEQKAEDSTIQNNDEIVVNDIKQITPINSLKDGLDNIEIKSNRKLFLESDSEEFKQFITSISLTGDEETDKEIIDFYRNKINV